MITKITSQIFVGDAQDARNATADQYDSTLNVAIDLDIEDKWNEVKINWIRRHKVGLIDGSGNDPFSMVAALILLHSLVKDGKQKVLVHCHAGKSRSIMVVAAYMELVGIATLDDALAKIMPIRKVDMYRPVMYNLARIAIPLAKEILKYGEKQQDFGDWA